MMISQHVHGHPNGAAVASYRNDDAALDTLHVADMDEAYGTYAADGD